MKNFVTLKQYADACGISVTVVRRRIASGKIQTENLNGATVIDINQFPPQGKQPVGRPRHDVLLAAITGR